MKSATHPKYNQIVITCNSCSTSFNSGSTLSDDFHVDMCSNCHPFFTGTQKIVDVANKARDFQNRQEAAKQLQEKIATIKAEKQKRLGKDGVSDSSTAPTTLKDMIKMLKQEK